MRRILFVDDEINVLRGLRRALHSMQGSWEMLFVQTGKEAIDALTRYKIDVIVSDMRMPEMNGIQLLDYVRKHFPNVVRIVLSGHADEQAVLQYVGKTHLFLSKPCDVKLLKLTVSRACAVKDVLSQPDLRKLITQIERLPSVPTIYLQLQSELRKQEPSIKKVAQIVSADMAMVTKVLQLVNSAFFGFYEQVTSAERAVVLLGINTIESLALTVKAFEMFDTSHTPFLNIDEMMKHSILTANFARTIGNEQGCHNEELDQILTAGLLHDIGKLILADNLPLKYSGILNKAQRENRSVWEVEFEVLGATHAEVGAYLTGLWGLPDSILEALAFHHDPERATNTQFCPLTAVHVADALIHEEKRVVKGSSPVTVNQIYLNSLNLKDNIGKWRSFYAKMNKGNRYE